uniref:Uncharacterized protein n=1 Tax=Rhizophora mucronata TaxID=61149 RepID=A0A2P2L4E7_RHIMU
MTNGVRPSSSRQAMNVPDHQEHIGEACEGSDNPEVVMRLESFGASEDNAKDKTPTSTSLGNIMEQSEDCSENVLKNKKMKLLTTCDNSMPSCTSKMSTDRDIVEVPISVELQKTPAEKTAKQEICPITPKTGGKGIKHSRKHMLGDQPSAKSDSLSGVEIVVTRKDRAVESAFRSSFHLTTVMERKVVDVATPNTNACQGGLKVAEVPVIFGLQDELMRRTLSKNVHQPSCDERLMLMEDQKYDLNGLPEEQSMEFNHLTYGGSIQKRKRGRPPKLALTNPGASVAGKDWGGGGIANEMDVQNQAEVPTCTVVDPPGRDRTGEALETDCKIKEVDMALAVASKNVTDDDQPLSMMFGGMHSSAGDSRVSSGKPANGWNETKERSADRAMDYSANEASNDLCLPFVRRSPVWKTIQSMEAFQIVPQQPHFHPLAECKEDYREGLAVGYMITFTSLFEKISSLQVEDPRSTLESILESLLDLQKHGFDVTLLQGRVNELLSIKEAQEELASQLKDSEREMKEQADSKRELQGKINEIEKKIAELQEELTAANVEMEGTDLNIARSSAKLAVINLRINNVRHDFEDAAAAPWRSP